MDCFIIVDKLINLDKNYENWNPLKYINQRYFFVIASTPGDNKLFADYTFIPHFIFTMKNRSQWNFMCFFFILLAESRCFIDSTRVNI